MGKDEIVKAFEVDDIHEKYQGDVQITDLKQDLGTKGHVLVVRGDKALEDQLKEDEKHIATPKLWVYEGILNSKRVKELLAQSPNHKLFDGVGFSGLAALGFHARRLGRAPIAVFARELVPNQDIVDKYGIEIIQAIGPAEEGYVNAQVRVIESRRDIIPLHQALYGVQALAPIGNTVAQLINKNGIKPDASFWCIASGSSMFGIGGKIKEKFPDCETVIAEPCENITVDYRTDFSNGQQVKNFAKRKLKQYGLDDWARAGRIYSGVFPLHVSGPNRYLLQF